MIRLVQLGIEHPHAAAYRTTLWMLRDRIEVVGFLRGTPNTEILDLGPFADVPVFDSLDDLLNATSPHAAQVMLRNDRMGGVLTTLANEGIHLWAEKPVARRCADLAPVAEIVNKKGLAFTAGFQSRFYPTNRHVREMIAQNLLGPLTFAHMITTTTTTQVRNPRGPLGYLFDPDVSGGGILHWLGCHMIDILLYVSQGQPTLVSATTATTGVEPLPIEDVATVGLTFSDGWIASLNYGYLLPTAESSPFEDDAPESGIYGQKGWARWNTVANLARAYSLDERWRDSPWRRTAFSTPAIKGYGHAAYLAMEQFANAIAGTEQTIYTIEQAMLVLAIIEAAYASAATGQRQSLDGALATAFVGR